MKKILSVGFAVFLVVSVGLAGMLGITANAQMGSVGDCYWDLNGTVLIINMRGYGEMGNFNADKILPWGNDITDLTVNEKIVLIGTYGFHDCASLKNITLPSSLKSIGEYAFYGCTSVERVNITNTEKWCGINFGNAYSNPLYYSGSLYLDGEPVKSLSLPDGITEITSYRFAGCQELEKIYLPKSTEKIEASAFRDSKGITDIYYAGDYSEWCKVSVCEDNGTLSEATVHYECDGITESEISEISVTELPNKLIYLKDEDELELDGGILSVTYTDRAVKDISLAAAEVEGFDNSVLGKQKLAVKYGGFTAELEIEIILKPIAFIAVAAYPTKREMAEGCPVSTSEGKIAVAYTDGKYDVFDLTDSMVSDYKPYKTGLQAVKVTYRGFETEFTVTVFKNGDLDGDEAVNASDFALLKTDLLGTPSGNERYDVNCDGKVDLLDLVRIKRLAAQLA